MYVMATNDSEGEPSPAGPIEKGYRPRSAFAAVPTSILNDQADNLPLRVALAMRFVEMCNNYTHPKGYMVGGPEGMEAVVIDADLHGSQDSAMTFACKCLADFFNGKEIPRERWE